MKTHLLMTCVLLFTSFFSANATERIVGNGTIITKDFSVEQYDGIEIGALSYGTNGFSFSQIFNSKRNESSTPVFYYTQGRTHSLSITTDKNIMGYLKIRVIDNVLTIRTEDGYNICPTSFTMRGSSVNLEKIQITGGGDFYLDSSLKGNELDAYITGGGSLFMENPVVLKEGNLKITGGGDLKAKSLSCEEININVTGGGDAYLQGKADEGEISITGGGDLHAYGFEIKKLDAHISGGGTAEVFVSENLNANVTGGGDLYYKGNPKAKKTHSTGGGDIHAVK